MAQGFCRPQADPAFVQSSERNDRGGLFSKIVRAAANDVEYIKARKGRTTQYIKERIEYLEGFLPMKYDQVVAWLEQQGIGMEGTGKALSGINRQLTFEEIEQQANIISGVKTYLEATGGGIRSQADSLLRAYAMGDDAQMVQTARDLASQMKHVSRLSATIMGFDQTIGTSLQLQRRVLDPDEAASFSRGIRVMADDGTMQTVTALGNARQGENFFGELAQKLNDPASQAEAIQDLMELARKLKYTTSPMEAFRITSTIDVARGMWREVWINGLLSAPRTFITNFYGVTWAVSRPMMQLLPAATISSLADAFGFKGLARSSGQVAAEAAAQLGQMRAAITDAAVLGWKAAVAERDIYKPLAGGSELVTGPAITGQAVQDAMYQSALNGGLVAKLSGNKPLDESWKNWIDLMGSVVRFPSRGMLGTDTMIKHLTIRGEVGAAAVRRLYEEGLDPSNRQLYQARLEQELRKAFHMDADEDMLQKWAMRPTYDNQVRARNSANEATFQQENSIATAVRRMVDRAPILRPFVPFIKTPVNIMATGIQSTGIPAALRTAGIVLENSTNPAVMMLALQEEFMKDPAKSYQLLGQMAVMSGVIAMTHQLVMDGSLTSGGPGRWSPGGKYSVQQQAWQKAMAAEGKIPYGLRVGNEYLPLDQAVGEPFAIWLRMVADASYLTTEMGPNEQDETMMAIAAVGVGGLFNATFLTGIQDLMDIASGDFGGGRKLSAAAQNWVSTQTPFGGMLNYVKNITENGGNPYKKIFWSDDFGATMRVMEDTWGQSLLGKVAARIPGISRAPVMVDQLYGEPVPLLPGQGRQGLNPFAQAIPMAPRGNPTGDVAWSQLFEIRGGVPDMKSGIDEYLTDREKQQFNRAMADATVNGLHLRQWIGQYHSRPEVQNFIKNRRLYGPALQTQIEDEVDTARRAYKAQAESIMRDKSPTYLIREQLVEQMKTAQEQNDVQAIDQIRQRLEQIRDQVKASE